MSGLTDGQAFALEAAARPSGLVTCASNWMMEGLRKRGLVTPDPDRGHSHRLTFRATDAGRAALARRRAEVAGA